MTHHPEWREELLRKLDGAAQLNMFPGQPNAYFAMAEMRMTAFRAEDEWLLTFEVVRAGDRYAALENEVSVFGSAFATLELRQVEVVTGPGGTDVWAQDGTFALDLRNLRVEVRGTARLLTPSMADLRVAGVDDPAMPECARAIRLLAAQLPGAMFLSDDELLTAAGRDGAGLTRFLQVGNWRQPEIFDDEMPSDVPCFQSLAAALAAGDPSAYHCPESEWNTHWSRWED